MKLAIGDVDVHAVKRDVSLLRGDEDFADIGDLQQSCLRSSAKQENSATPGR